MTRGGLRPVTEDPDHRSSTIRRQGGAMLEDTADGDARYEAIPDTGRKYHGARRGALLKKV